MYEKIVIAFQQLMSDKGCGEKFMTNCLKSASSLKHLIVLTDLKKYSFKSTDRLTGMDMCHSKLLLKKLAKFHAVSSYYREQNEYPETFLNGTYSMEMKDIFDRFILTTIDTILDYMKTWPIDVKYVSKITALKPNFFAKLHEITKFYPNAFNVLNHGDLWTNNIMFEYDENGMPRDLLFVDLQLPYLATPGVDLNYFIISSCKTELKTAEYDTFIQYYHEKLVSTLIKLEYTGKIPTLLDMQITALKAGYVAVLASLIVLPISLVPSCEEADANTLFDSNADGSKIIKDRMFNNPVYVEAMQLLLPFFDKRGWLEI